MSDTDENLNLPPDRKESLSRSSVVAIRPAASMVEPLPKKMPFGLIRMIRPFAETAPKMSDGATPTTLFAVTDDADGWLKRTDSPFATEKLFHSMNARSDDWSIVTREVP